jgi:hypothetical protein
MTRRGTPAHVHRKRSKLGGAGAAGWGEQNGSVVRRFVEELARPIAGKWRLFSAEGVELAAGDDEFRIRQMASAIGEGARVEEVVRKRRSAA